MQLGKHNPRVCPGSIKLTVPKKQNGDGFCKIFYVSSESDPTEVHIVTRVGHLFARYFCDCKDFMVRKLTDSSTVPGIVLMQTRQLRKKF